MNTLERRYRRLLGLLPDAYRRAWEDDMVATFLDRMSTGDSEVDEYLEEFGRPDADEVLSVVALAIRLRLAGPDGEPRAALWGQAVRTFALTCLLANALRWEGLEPGAPAVAAPPAFQPARHSRGVRGVLRRRAVGNRPP